jgi:hypothetical protein
MMWFVICGAISAAVLAWAKRLERQTQVAAEARRRRRKTWRWRYEASPEQREDQV